MEDKRKQFSPKLLLSFICKSAILSDTFSRLILPEYLRQLFFFYVIQLQMLLA